MNLKEKLSNQVTLKSLNRTSTGHIYHCDLKNIFAALLYCLDLKDGSKKQSSMIKFNFKNSYPYSFTVEKAIAVMANMNINLQYHVTLTVFSYQIKDSFALELLNLFYAAKLLHSPDDKTSKKISGIKMILQPTPKGVAILHQFCLKMGISNIKDLQTPLILYSNFNSMKLMEFDRHFRTDNLIHNTQSLRILFALIMGPKMNLWSPKNAADVIPNLGSALSLKSQLGKTMIYNASNYMQNVLESGDAFLAYLRQRQAESLHNEIEEENQQKDHSASKKTIKDTISPFYHRFFTNPDSDSHIQYYVANKGLRFFEKKTTIVNGKNKIIRQCFSGKALTQYLMDCTDLMYGRDAFRIANAFLKQDWIRLQSKKSDVFLSTREAIYTLTENGKVIVKWASSENLNCGGLADDTLGHNISFDKSLRDPALKYLFRNFLIDNMCVENIDAYDDIVDFQKKMKILKRMISLKDKEKKRYLEEIKNDAIFDELKSNELKHKKLTIYTAINKLLEYCLSKIYSIFAMYISDDAPNEVNIDSKLRFQVQHYIEKEVDFDTMALNVADLRMRCMETELELEEPVRKLSTHHEDDREVPQLDAGDISPKTACPSNPVLNLKHLREIDLPPVSPTDIIFGPKLKFLEDVSIFYEEIKRKVYHMMEVDSFGKFLSSKHLKENYL